MKRKTVRWIFLILFIGLIGAQLIRPPQNTGSAATPTDITHFVTVPDTVMGLLKKSCYDCHSNNTHYPWYVHLTPVNFFMARHVKRGKEELNFSDFSQYSRRRMKSKLTSTSDQVKDGEMPLKSYILMHGDARLTDAERKMIQDWVDAAKNELQLKTP